MNRTNIDWPGLVYTWNPVVGCLRKCHYCYAKKMYNRFYKIPFEKIVFHPERLDQPKKITSHTVIFVGSMTDIAYWTIDEKLAVMKVCFECPQHTFMFLSKSPGAYMGINIPKNVMCGLTVTHINDSNYEHVDWFAKVGRRPFLSIEPILGMVKYSISDRFELVIVGAMTGKGALPHDQSWVDSVFEKSYCKNIHLKQNVKKEVGCGTKNIAVG
jgi:protein gp37